MVAKFVIVLSLAAVAYGGLLPGGKVLVGEAEAPAHYEFSYSVQDAHSGDVKQQQESRAGNAVSGSYSLLQPDGVRRVVHYSADEHQGFNALVSYEGTTHSAPAGPVANLAYAAPVAKFAYAAPVTKVAYAAPITKVAYAAPINKVAYAAPVAKVAYAAPITKYGYASAPVAQVSYSSPIISYQH